MATTDSSRMLLDFAPLIDARTRQFTGRRWVFKEIGEWLGDKKGSRVFLLTGGPGTGKTAIAARLVQMHLGKVPSDPVTILSPSFLAHFHFCQAGLDSTLSPQTFVESLSQTLANQYPAYRTALEKQGSQQFVISPVVTVRGNVAGGAQVTGARIDQIHIEILGGDARPLFDQMVRRPLHELCESSSIDSIAILVDSLDEALSFNPDTNIAQLLRLLQDFPPQVRFFLTCRSNDHRVFDLVGPPTLDLIADAPPGVDEVRAYAAGRLAAVPEPGRNAAADLVAQKSKGNFLYAYHVLNDLARPGVHIGSTAILDLPDALEDVYRKFLQRELASTPTRWNDVYRPLLGLIAVARGDGLSKAQLIGMTGLAQDTANDVLRTCSQYLVCAEADSPYRIYHQSFRDFLLYDEKFGVFPAERHATIARYLQDKCGASWSTCNDEYALRYTPAHWAGAAELSANQREIRTQTLIELVTNGKYQRRFERRIRDLPALQDHVNRAVRVTAMCDQADMLPWLIRVAQDCVAFRRDFLQAEAVVDLAAEGKFDQAEARLRLFADIDEDWQRASRLIIAWIGAERSASEAEQMRARVIIAGNAAYLLSLLSDRVKATLGHQGTFAFEQQSLSSLQVAQEMVKRVSGQEFDRELLASAGVGGVLGPEMEMGGKRGYAAAVDAPILVNVARDQGDQGTALVDQYIDAHAGYNYVEYRNRSLWFVLHAVLRFHPEQEWVKQRLRKILVIALAGGGVDFREMLPLTALLSREAVVKRDARPELEKWRSLALVTADQLQAKRGADDSWGNHKRRLTGLLELATLLIHDRPASGVLLNRIRALPGGFAGFQAPASLRLADALLACSLSAPGLREGIIEEALRSAHHIQDYHFCARVTARCNALKRWHKAPLSATELEATIHRLASSPGDAEFAADHFVHEEYRYREKSEAGVLPVEDAQRAETLEELVEVFQRPAVEFRRLNPQYGLTQKLEGETQVRVPDPGFAPLLAVHLGARTFAEAALDDQRGALVRTLVPVAMSNPTALDTLLSYLLIAAEPEDAELLEDIAKEAGSVVFSDVAPPAVQIGPDGTTPS
jgi:hypothetical protein